MNSQSVRNPSLNFRRRDLLRGLGAGAVLLSPFESRRRALAQTTVAGPGNFFFFFTANGFVRSRFGSDGNDAAFTLRPASAPLEPWKDQITFLRGLSNKSQHERGLFHFNITRLLTCMTGMSQHVGYGPSIDQVIATLIDRPALNLITYWPRQQNQFTMMTWKKYGISAPHINDSRAAYKAVFGAATPTGTSAELEATLARKRSLMDLVLEDITMYRSRVPTADRGRLDTHLESMRQLEKQITAMPSAPMPKACDAKKADVSSTYEPPKDGTVGAYDIAAFEAHNAVQMDLAVTAMACGLRNSITFMNQGGGGGLNPLGGEGEASDHHQVSHGFASATVWSNIDHYYSKRFGMLLGKLRDQGILDRTAVVWGSEITEAHMQNNQTFAVAGGKDLGLKLRKSIALPFSGDEGGGPAVARNASNASLSDLWVTIQRACGVKSDSFGHDSNGPLSQLWSPP